MAPSVVPHQAPETSPAATHPQIADGGGSGDVPPAVTRGPRQRDSKACIVPSCHIRLSDEGQSSIRLRACLEHRNAMVVNMHDGRKGRFCQQCAKLQPIEDFDGDRRGCRKRLQRLQNRRRTKALARKVPRSTAPKEFGAAAGGNREGPPMPYSRGEDHGAQHELYAEKNLSSLREESNMPAQQDPGGGTPCGSDERKHKAAHLNPAGNDMSHGRDEHLTTRPPQSYQQLSIQDPASMDSRYNSDSQGHRAQGGGSFPLDELSRGSKGSDCTIFHGMQRSLWHVSSSHGRPQYTVTMMMHNEAGPYEDVPKGELIEALTAYHQVQPAIVEINTCRDVMRTSVIFVMKNEEAYLKSLNSFPERFLEGMAGQKHLPWCKHDTDVLLPDMAIQVREGGDYVVTSGRCPASRRQSQSQHSARGHGTPPKSAFIDLWQQDNMRQIAPPRSMPTAASLDAYPLPFGAPEKVPGSSKSSVGMEYMHRPPQVAELAPDMEMRRHSEQHELQPSDLGRDMHLHRDHSHRDMGIGHLGHQRQVSELAHVDIRVSGHQSVHCPPQRAELAPGMAMRHSEQHELQPSDTGRGMQLHPDHSHRDMGVGHHGYQRQVPEIVHMDMRPRVAGHQSRPQILQMDTRHLRQHEYAQGMDMHNQGHREAALSMPVEDLYHQVTPSAEMGMRRAPRHYQYESELEIVCRRQPASIAPENVPGAEAAPWRHGYHRDISPRHREEQQHGMPTSYYERWRRDRWGKDDG